MRSSETSVVIRFKDFEGFTSKPTPVSTLPCLELRSYGGIATFYLRIFDRESRRSRTVIEISPCKIV